MAVLRQQIWFATVFLLGAVFANAQEDVPARTAQVADALSGTHWREVEPGLLHIGADAGGISINAFLVDAKRYRFAISVQRNENGETAESAGLRNHAALTVNGGFFGEKTPGKNLFPVGLLRVKGRSFSEAWPSQGGFVVLGDDGLAIVPTGHDVPDTAANVVQSRPIMIEPGGRWAMNSNQRFLRPRTLVCVLPDRDVVVAVVTGVGLSLFEAGWLFREPAVGGYFGCDSAIALDGGGSTQLWFDRRADLSVRGETPVHNFLNVVRRD